MKNNKIIGGGLAVGYGTHSGKLTVKLEKGWRIKVKQKLCDLESESEEEDIIENIDRPELMKPICDGSDRVTICNIIPGAVLKVYMRKQNQLSWKPVGAEGAIGYCNDIVLGDNIVLADGDYVYVKEVIGNIESDSEPVRVVKTSDPVFTIGNGPYCNPCESQDYGPVFVRRSLTNKFGPVFRATMCGPVEAANVEITFPGGNNLPPVSIDLKEKKKGYYEGEWDWKEIGWTTYKDIPVGKYMAKFTIWPTGVGTQVITKDMPFYVFKTGCVEFEVLHCGLTDKEKQLANLINEYRKEHSLDTIPVTNSFQIVARSHAIDLNTYHPDTGNCNMHSWSSHGEWDPMCYTEYNPPMAKMWSKPGELTNYGGDGYEIVATGSTPQDILNEWLNEPKNEFDRQPHVDVILQKDIWESPNWTWKAMGVGIDGGYGVVWFGKIEDPAGNVKGT